MEPVPGLADVRVVALGGGHGLSASLAALRHVVTDLTAVVTVADNGGSSGRLRREFGVRLAFGDQPGDPPSEHPGLARAGAGDDQQRGAGMHHRGPLWVVQPVEQLLGGGRTPAGAGALGGLV